MIKLSFQFFFGAVGVLVLSPDAWADDLGRSPDRFDVVGEVLETEDVSALSLSPQGTGVLAADEGRKVQLLSALPGGAGVRITGDALLGEPGKQEYDLEAAAFDGRWFYLTGSHGAGKKDGEPEPSRDYVFRFKIAPGGRAVEDVARVSLAPLISRDPVLGPHFRKPLQRSGVNIEGLAARGTELFFGFRNPNIDHDTFILQIDADALFRSPASAPYQLHRVRVGEGLGIRSLAATADGFLMVTGNAGSEADPEGPFASSENHTSRRGSFLHHWRPGDREAPELTALPRISGKPEALEILAESDQEIDLVILSDSAPRGGARRFILKKPAAAPTGGADSDPAADPTATTGPTREPNP